MFGFLLSSISFASSRLLSLALVVAIWLLSRPGGWAVLVVLVLVGVKLLPDDRGAKGPEAPPAASALPAPEPPQGRS